MFEFNKFIIFLLKIIIIIKISNNNNYVYGGMSAIGSAIELFNPCQSNVRSPLTMQREIGGRPNKENYWDGTIDLSEWPAIREVRITLTVDQSAKIELDENDGRVLVQNRTFHISYYDSPPKITRVKFTIRGQPFGAFPNVEQLELNGENICKNPVKWTPTILGTGLNTGETEDENPPIQSCGKRLVTHQGLITNGYPSQEGDWPWHTAIYHITTTKITSTTIDNNNFSGGGSGGRLQTEYKCGGTLLNEKFILTASHCVYEFGHALVSERLIVQLGKHNLKIGSKNTQDFQVHEVMVHEQYDSNDLKNDLALLRLATVVQFNNYVQPICLWPENRKSLQAVINRQGIVVGWGFTETDDQLSTVLRQARMPVVSIATCLSSNRQFFGFFLSDMNYCAGYRNGTSVCNGDSGGGMFFEENQIYYLRGIVSLSLAREDRNLCNTKEYIIFTDVAKYLNWINDKIS